MNRLRRGRKNAEKEGWAICTARTGRVYLPREAAERAETLLRPAE